MGQDQVSFLSGLSSTLEDKRTGWVLNVAIVALIIAALLLPPVSAQDRILDAGYETIDQETGGSAQDPDGMQVTVWPQGLEKDVKLKVESVPRASFMDGSAGSDMVEAAKQLPSHLHVKSPIYTISLKGEMPESASLVVPIPNNAEPYESLSLYNWTGEQWEFLSSHLVSEEDVLEAHLGFVPQAVAAIQSAAQPPRVSAQLPEYVSLPGLGDRALTELNPLGYYLGSENNIEGSLPTLPAMEGGESYRVLPTLRNWTDDGVVRSDLADNMLVVPESREAHVQAIVDLVVSEMYGGIDLDYRGINPDLRDEYASFVERLAGELHANGKRLTVHAESPVQVSEDSWNTGAYDWTSLGQAVDGFKFPASQDPVAYAPGGQMERLLWWAVGEVERYKLQPSYSARSVENAGGVLLEHTYRDALSRLSEVVVQQADDVLDPGEQVTLSLDTAGVQFDPSLGQYWFTYFDEASGQERTVWLEDASSASRKLELLSRFNLGGVAFTSLWDEGNDPRMWDLVRDYQGSGQAGLAPVDSNFAVQWSVENSSAGLVLEETGGLEQGSYTWTAAEPGEYQIGAAVVANDGQTVAGSDKIALVVVTPSPTPTPTPTPTPVPTMTPTPLPSPTPSPTPIPPTATPTPKPATSSASNPQPATQPASSGGSSNPPPNTNFGYGIQAHMVHNGQEGTVMAKVKDMGFGWVKQQVEWKHFETSQGNYDFNSLDPIVNAAKAAGVKVLFSAVNAPNWARPGGDLSVGGPPSNPQDFANFLGALAGRYCGGGVGAIEVWNEQNLHYEWGNMKIDPAAYMALLKPAYNKIKAACPNMIVVSGALTPTGAPPPKAMDDYAYLEGMYQNGLKNFSDAIGAHPSGFNVAPWVKGGQASCDFITQQGSSFRGPCNTLHHSWSFYATMNGYYNIMKKYGDGRKKIWPTEFGWATNWIGDPSYGYAQDNTRSEQATWTVEAYKLMKQWGFVGVAFLWNLNFDVVAGGTEKAQWGIVHGDWSATETYNKLKAMPK